MASSANSTMALFRVHYGKSMTKIDYIKFYEILSSPKKTRHPINKSIYFEKLMKILTMMVYQHSVWPFSSAITAAILLGMNL